MKHEWPGADLTIEQVPEGLFIRQGAESYLARKWTMSPELLAIFDQAINAGLDCVLRHNHPKPNNRATHGVAYIGFSRNPSERWLFVLDQYSCKNVRGVPTIGQLTFEKHYKPILESVSIPFRFQSGGGQNVFVDYEHASQAITVCSAAAELIESELGAREWEEAKARLGILTEAKLESYIVQNYRGIPHLSHLDVVRNQVSCPLGIIDILARTSDGGHVIVELKRGKVGAEAIQQAQRYASCIAEDGKVSGVIVIARDFFPGALAARASSPVPVSLFKYQDQDAKISMHPVP